VPATPQGICAAVQGILIHDYFGAHLYDTRPEGFDTASRETRRAEDRLRLVMASNASPITQRRSAAERSVGTCRDFAVMACALFRHHGIPARVRCGFARYFHPPTYEDHWVCQYWQAHEARWVTVDPQLDKEHLAHLSIVFDPCDLPAEAFLFPWQVWQDFGARSDELRTFGHGEATGAWFVQVNLARDVLALCKTEVSPWDTWREQQQTDDHLSDQALALCSDLADASAAMDQGRVITRDRLDDILGRLNVPPWRHPR